MTDGRFTLGLGAGWMDEEFRVYGLPYPETKERVEMLEEAMAYLRAAITPGTRGFKGKYFTLEEFDPHPHPKSLRLMVHPVRSRRSRPCRHGARIPEVGGEHESVVVHRIIGNAIARAAHIDYN